MRGGLGYVVFRDGTRIEFDQPLNTLDPRYDRCTTHHVGCICREAEWSEEAREYRLEWENVRKLIAGDILAGHPDGCMCTGCRLVREIGLSHLIRIPQEEMPF